MEDVQFHLISKRAKTSTRKNGNKKKNQHRRNMYDSDTTKAEKQMPCLTLEGTQATVSFSTWIWIQYYHP